MNIKLWWYITHYNKNTCCTKVYGINSAGRLNDSVQIKAMNKNLKLQWQGGYEGCNGKLAKDSFEPDGMRL